MVCARGWRRHLVLHKLCIYFLDTKARQMLRRPFSRQQGPARPPSLVPVSRDRWLLLDGDLADHLVFEFLQVLLRVALRLHVSGLVAEFALLRGRPRGGGDIGISMSKSIFFRSVYNVSPRLSTCSAVYDLAPSFVMPCMMAWEVRNV
jgi:hypothetical protein